MTAPHEKCWPWCKCAVENEIAELVRDKEILLALLTDAQMDEYRELRAVSTP